MFVLLAYFTTYFFIVKIKEKNKQRFKNFPPMKMNKNGLVFNSFDRHRLKIDDFKFIQIGTNLYIKTSKEIVTITNINNVEKIGNFIYLTALGKVQIVFACKDIYRYFNIEIISSEFTIKHLKQIAMQDIVNNFFNIDNCRILKKYVNIIQNVLNIHIFEKKIMIKQNKFFFPYTIKYKINNRIKLVNVNQTLEEN